MSTTTSLYRFVGVYTGIIDVDELKVFGQQTKLTDEQAETVLRGGGMILPEADFFQFFTPEDLKAKSFPKFPGQWLSASPDLQAKKKAAVALAVTRHYALVAAAEKAEIERVAQIAAKAKADRDLAIAQAEETQAALAKAASEINANEQAITDEQNQKEVK